MFLLVTLTFCLAHAMAGGPAFAMLGFKSRPEAVDLLNVQLGLKASLWHQYAAWWWHLLHGDLGTSYFASRPVAAMIGAYAAQTALLYAIGTAAAVLLATGIGLLHGTFYRRWPGRVLSAVEITLYAMPAFFIGTLLCLVFATWLRWLPAGGMEDLRLEQPGLADHFRHLVLPAASVALLATPWLARILAQSVHGELSLDYVRTARARGLPTSRILFRHVAPNALRPFVTMLGFWLPAIFSGSVMVESVFDYPGLGWLLWRSALAQDYPVLLGIVLTVGVATVVGNLLADIVNSALDPRARFV